jgi:RNA recognition motif-containing protein
MTNIFVARLDFGVSQEELKKAFEQYGKVNKVTIATDKETGKPKGFAFVEMFNEDEANNAIKSLDGTSLNGRQIAVKQAEDRRDNNRRDSNDRKPFNRDNNRNSQDQRSNNQTQSDTRVKNEDVTPNPSFASTPTSTVNKNIIKKKDNFTKKTDDKPKVQKMAAYKKSGKQQKFFYDDEDDMY